MVISRIPWITVAGETYGGQRRVHRVLGLAFQSRDVLVTSVRHIRSSAVPGDD